MLFIFCNLSNKAFFVFLQLAFYASNSHQLFLCLTSNSSLLFRMGSKAESSVESYEDVSYNCLMLVLIVFSVSKFCEKVLSLEQMVRWNHVKSI